MGISTPSIMTITCYNFAVKLMVLQVDAQSSLRAQQARTIFFMGSCRGRSIGSRSVNKKWPNASTPPPTPLPPGINEFSESTQEVPNCFLEFWEQIMYPGGSRADTF